MMFLFMAVMACSGNHGNQAGKPARRRVLSRAWVLEKEGWNGVGVAHSNQPSNQPTKQPITANQPHADESDEI